MNKEGEIQTKLGRDKERVGGNERVRDEDVGSVGSNLRTALDERGCQR